VCILISCSYAYEEIETPYKKLIIKYGVVQFEKEKWRVADPQRRGRMIKNLFNRHKFIGKKVNIINSMLGDGDCYINYEHTPCYELNYEGGYYYLVFGIGHPSSQ